MNIKKFIIASTLPTLVCLSLLAGCRGVNDVAQTEVTTQAENTAENTFSESDPATASFFAMDTIMELTAYGENASEAVSEGQALVTDIENELSTEIETSSISKLNKDKTTTAEGYTIGLLETALEVNAMTDGAFNISLYPLMKEWGFTTQDYKVPDASTIKEILEYTDLSDITFDKDAGTITLENEEMAIDLGGIAKGFTSASLIDLFKDEGITSGMVNLGGNVQLLGNKPDGSLWRVGIRSPYDDVDFLGILSAADVAVITSGGYERYFEEDGNIYHHIMDPETGYPAQNGLISVTVVSEDATLADALSTALFVMGREKAEDFWRAHSDEFDMILMDEEDRLYVTEGIYDDFTSDHYEVNVITNK